MGRLQRILEKGQFALTGEITPPASSDLDELLAKAAPLKGLADAVNVTDGAGARAHLESTVAAGVLLRNGIGPLPQPRRSASRTSWCSRETTPARAISPRPRRFSIWIPRVSRRPRLRCAITAVCRMAGPSGAAPLFSSAWRIRPSIRRPAGRLRA